VSGLLTLITGEIDMFKLKKRYRLLVACLFVFFWQGVMGEALTVVSSNTSKYERGDELKDGQRVELRKGEKITLKDEKGSQHSFSGYFSALVKTVKKLFDVDRGDVFELWQIDVLRGEVFCYEDAAQVMLGRGYFDAQEKTILHLSNINSHKQVQVTLRVEETERQWPSDRLPIISGQKYEVQINNNPFDKKFITLYQLSPEEKFSEPDQKAARMIEKGCERQGLILNSQREGQ
jgi:hypothetical protein